MALWIDEIEAYPIYDIDDEDGRYPLGNALSVEDLAEYEKVKEVYYAWQDRLGKIYKSLASVPAESV